MTVKMNAKNGKPHKEYNTCGALLKTMTLLGLIKA